jgi:hypothetical protein
MVVLEPTGVRVHPELLPAFRTMRDPAAGKGIALEVASGFLDFERDVVRESRCATVGTSSTHQLHHIAPE